MKKALIVILSLFLINCSKNDSESYPIIISYCINGSNIDIKNNFTKSAFRKRKEGYDQLFYKIKNN
jgi:hypothetical protein